MKNIINRIKNDKVLFFLSILIIGVFLVLVIRITYSYLAAFINEARENVTLGSDTVDEFKFIEGDKLDLNVTPTTLPEGGGNYSQSTTYKASLLANSTNNSAEESYYVYFDITENTLQYIEEGNPEVILSVFQGETEITNIDGLTYGTYNGVAGFDITTITGLYTIASDYAITSNSSENATIQDWTFTLTYLNQSYDQSANYGNKMNVEIIMSKEAREVSLADLCNGLTLSECITTQVYDESNEEATGLYYHDADLANSAADNSYRYAGANPNNYVCFGSDAATCPSANLYRIIGVFGNEVKLIKADYTTTSQTGTGGAYYNTYSGAGHSSSYYKGNQSLSSIGTYYWNPSGSNTWSSSSLTTTNLNNTFLNSFSSTWQNKIATHTWYVGGHSTSNATPKTFYNAESTGTTWSGKIGLMYVSDYGYAASNSAWTTNMGSYNSVTSNNWMYMGLYEWTISRNSSGSGSAFIVHNAGRVVNDFVNMDSDAVRPSFYLNSSVNYVSGSGSSADPIRIS